MADDELKKQRDVLELALSSAEMGVWDWDVVSGKSHWDERCKALFGVPLNREVDGTIFMDRVHPDDRILLGEQGGAFVKGRDDFKIEYRIIRPDGETRWVASHGRIIRDPATGKANRMAGVVFDITQRKQAEQSLSASRETLDLAMDVAEIGTWTWDIAGGPGDWDERARRIFCVPGHSPPSYELFHSIVHPEDRGTLEAANERAIAGGTEYVVEYRIIRPDGQVRWISSRGRVVRDESGRAIRVNGVCSDVTARKLAEVAMRDSEQRYRALAEAMPHIVWTVDAEGKVDYLSGKGQELLGLSAGLTIDDACAAITHPEDHERATAERARVLHGGEPSYQSEHRLRHVDGTHHWYLCKGVVTRDAAGRIVKLYGSHTLIDSQKRAAQDRLFLDELGERLRTHLDVEELVYDASRVVGEYLNACGCGMSEVDMERNRFVILKDYHAQECPSIQGERPITEHSMRGIREYLAGRAMVVNDTQTHPATADRFDAAYAKLNVRAFVGVPVARHGKLMSAFWVNNATPRDWSDEDVALIWLAGERIWAAIERVRLRAAEHAARLAAEHASRAKDQFIAVLSHELRTPLNPVLATITAMEAESTLPAAMRGELSMVRRNVELEARLIDDLLDLTRIARGKMELRRQTADAHALLRHVMEICRPELEEKSLDLSIDIAATEHHVNADPARLQQIFWNLIKNAIKFTGPKGSVSVRTEDRGDSFVLTVTDTGIGIPANALTRIFDAFEQASPDINRRFGGLGLGLAISKALVDAHGGTLVADSQGAGKGASFTLSLPHVAAGPQEAPRIAPTQAMRQLKILLVEDHFDTARVMGRLLRNFGHEVTAAHSVSEAKAVLSVRAFDLLLSDLGLPDASGHDLMRHVRANYPRLPAIAISGYGTDDDIHKSLDAGFTEHITKPINVQMLEEMLARVGNAEARANLPAR